MRLETTNPVTMRGKYSKQKETTIRIKSRRVRLLLGHAGDIHGRVRLCNIFVGQGKSTIHQLNVSFVFYLFVFIYLFIFTSALTFICCCEGLLTVVGWCLPSLAFTCLMPVAIIFKW